MKFSRQKLIDVFSFMRDNSRTVVSEESFHTEFHSKREGQLALEFAKQKGFVEHLPEDGWIILKFNLVEGTIRSELSESVQYEVSWYEL